MKKLFIYYSYTGNGDFVASFLKNNGYDIKKIITKEPLPKNRGLSILTGGFKALVGYQDKIENIDLDLNSYDQILIGSPIWNSRLSSPINSVLKLSNLANRCVDFVLYSGSGKATSALSKIKKEYENSEVIVLKEPKNNEENMKNELKKMI